MLKNNKTIEKIKHEVKQNYIMFVIDNTGIVRDREGLKKHLESDGAAKVLLTAPGKGDVPNVVFGVNHTDLDQKETIFSAASCTTNAIVPVLKIV